MRIVFLLHILLVASTSLAQIGTTPTTRFNTMAEMVAATIPAINTNSQARITALVAGRVTANDGGGGIFYYVPGSTTATNLGTVFKPAGTTGRWLRDYSGAVDVKWFGAVGDGVTDDTTAIQAALNLIPNSGAVRLSRGVYVISSSLTFPGLTSGSHTNIAPVSFVGDGPLNSILLNKAPASTPTFVVNRRNSTIQDMGFIGHLNFPNVGVKYQENGHLSYLKNCWSYMNGDYIWLEKVHSVSVIECYGGGRDGLGAIANMYSTTGWTYASTNAFIKMSIPNGGFVNQINITDCKNEDNYWSVYTDQAGTGYFNNIQITGNQFESSTGGIYLKGSPGHGVYIVGNYLGEGSTTYSIQLDNVRGGVIGPNYIHSQDDPDKALSTIFLNDCPRMALFGQMDRLYITGASGGIVVNGFVRRIQDESTDKDTTYNNVQMTDVFTLPLRLINRQAGFGVWYSDTGTNTSLYPYIKAGDVVWKTTQAAGSSPGWVCNRASAVGALVQTVGAGPDPTVLTDYFYPTARDYRITITTGGATGTAIYKVEDKTAGGGAYADLVTGVTTTELAHLISDRFQIRWPTGVTYVLNDQWTLTAVVTALWEDIPTIGGFGAGSAASPSMRNATTDSTGWFFPTGTSISFASGGSTRATFWDGSSALKLFRAGESLTLQGVAVGDNIYQSWRNSAGTERGYFGFASGGDPSIFLVANEASGNLEFNSGNNGNINLTVAGSGRVRANTDVDVTTAGFGLRIKEGSNAKLGTAVLNGASPSSVVVSTTAVGASSRIFLTINTPGAAPGAVYVSARLAGNTFTITGPNTDTSTVAWMIVDPAP